MVPLIENPGRQVFVFRYQQKKLNDGSMFAKNFPSKAAPFPALLKGKYTEHWESLLYCENFLIKLQVKLPEFRNFDLRLKAKRNSAELIISLHYLLLLV